MKKTTMKLFFDKAEIEVCTEKDNKNQVTHFLWIRNERINEHCGITLDKQELNEVIMMLQKAIT